MAGGCGARPDLRPWCMACSPSLLQGPWKRGGRPPLLRTEAGRGWPGRMSPPRAVRGGPPRSRPPAGESRSSGPQDGAGAPRGASAVTSARRGVRDGGRGSSCPGAVPAGAGRGEEGGAAVVRRPDHGVPLGGGQGRGRAARPRHAPAAARLRAAMRSSPRARPGGGARTTLWRPASRGTWSDRSEEPWSARPRAPAGEASWLL